MPIPGKPIHECSAREVRALLAAGTIISLIILAGSFFSRQPDWFLWIVRGFVALWLLDACRQGLKRLRDLRNSK